MSREPISSNRRAICKRPNSHARSVLATSTLAITFALGACAQALVPAPPFPAPSQTVLEPSVHFYGNDSMFASQPSTNAIAVYGRKANGLTLKLEETLTYGLSAPMGMVTTADRWLYVVNSGYSNVLVYRTPRKGPKGPVATLDDHGQVPVNVAVTPNRRLVAVSNASTSSGGAGSVSVYLNREAEPSRVLSYGSDPVQGEGIAIDSDGNCYWSFNDPTKLTGSIVKFTDCGGRGALFESGILDVGGMAFDQNGNLYYVDQLLGIYKCTGASCGLWLSVGGLGGLILPKNINFDNSSPQNLWIADAGGYIDAASPDGIIEYILDVIGGVTNPPNGIAPVPGS